MFIYRHKYVTLALISSEDQLMVVCIFMNIDSFICRGVYMFAIFISMFRLSIGGGILKVYMFICSFVEVCILIHAFYLSDV